MSQSQRIYFDRKDEQGNIITCFYDATKDDDGNITLQDWGELIDRTAKRIGNETIYDGGRCAKPAFLLEIINQKLPETVFCEDPFAGSFEPKTKNQEK